MLNIYKKYNDIYIKYLGVWQSHRAFRSQSFKQKPLKRISATITNSKSNPKKTTLMRALLQ